MRVGGPQRPDSVSHPVHRCEAVDGVSDNWWLVGLSAESEVVEDAGCVIAFCRDRFSFDEVLLEEGGQMRKASA